MIIIKIYKAAVLLLILLCFSQNLISSPSFTAANRWEMKNKRNAEMNGFEISENTRLTYTFKETPSDNSVLIFKSGGSEISVFTRGKVLYRGCKKYGYNVIDISEMKKGSKLFMQLKPLKKTGRILSTPKITTKNDYLYSLLKGAPLLLLALLCRRRLSRLALLIAFAGVNLDFIVFALTV